MHSYQVAGLILALVLAIGGVGRLQPPTVAAKEDTQMMLYSVQSPPASWQWHRKTQLQGCWFGVIDSASEWSQLVDTHSFLRDRLPVNTNWEHEIVVVAALGEAPTGGHAVKIVAVDLKGNEVKVMMNLRSPSPVDMVTQVITYPVDIIKLSRQGLPAGDLHWVFVNQEGSVLAP